MHRLTPPALFLVLLLPAALPVAAAAQDEMLLIAFGDSITEGFGDDSQQGGGYPARLQRWLRQRGYDATVVNAGLGGETTGEGLSRVDDVLAGGGDYFLLMEGTNDISQRVGVETIAFNLDEMATRAEAAGMTALHGTCIPRLPTAGADSSNARTAALAASLVDLGAVHGRLVADQFTLFESLPDLFDSYYYDGEDDPVGHPNGAGYQEMGGLWLETMLLLLEAPQIQIVPPPAPVSTGNVVVFGAETSGAFQRLEWEFGDGGWAAVESAPLEFAEHVYLAPGTYQVTVTGETAAGGQASDALDLVVGGGTVTWPQRQSALPILLRGDGSADDDLVAGITISNPREEVALVDLVLAPEISYDEPPPMRRLLLPALGVTEVGDLLGELFRLQRARGALLLTYRAPPQTGIASISSLGTLALAADGGAGDDVAEVLSGQWSTVQKTIVGLTGGAVTTLELAVANLDLGSGYVQLDLYDNAGALVDSALFELGPADVRLRRLTDLYRGLESRPQPFTAVFRAAGVRFTAAAVAVDPLAGSVTHYSSVP